MEIRFDKSTIVVIGGSTGIGQATVKLFVQSGGKVIFTGIEEESDIDINDYYDGAGPVPVYRMLDMRIEEDVKRLADYVESEHNGCDVLFNNAAIVKGGILHETTTEDWKRIMDTNVNGIYFASKYFIPQMMKKGGGSIINTTSISGLFGDYNSSAYCTSKGAAVNLTRTMALDYAKYNIRVNAIAPGATKTKHMHYDLADNVGGIDVLDFGASVVYPAKRIGLPEEVANAVAFLASDKASFISGINLAIDGGITAHTGQQHDYKTARLLMSLMAKDEP